MLASQVQALSSKPSTSKNKTKQKTERKSSFFFFLTHQAVSASTFLPGQQKYGVCKVELISNHHPVGKNNHPTFTFFFFFVALGLELRALHLLDRHFTT
jgi:hypothetical protein